MNGDDRTTLNKILLLAGETKAGVEGVSKGLTEVKQEVSHVKDSLAKTVTRESCEANLKETRASHAKIWDGIHKLESKVPRSDETPLGRELTNPGIVPGQKSIKYYLGLITAVLGILSFAGGLIYTVFTVGRYMERVDQTVKRNADETRKAQVQIKSDLRKVVSDRAVRFVPMPMPVTKEQPAPRRRRTPRRTPRPTTPP